MFTPAFWWTIVGIGLMLCEFVVPGLILFFFGLGALIVAGVCVVVDPSLSAQLGIFAVASLASLFGLRRFLKPVFFGATRTSSGNMSEGMVGQSGKVTEAIEPNGEGKVELNGAAGKAVSSEPLDVGARVVVIEQRSLTVVVESE